MLTDEDLEIMYHEHLRKQTHNDIVNNIYMKCDECGELINPSSDHCTKCGRNISIG